MGRKLLKKGETPDQFQTELYDKITKIEAQVLERIQKLKTNSKSFVCQHFNLSTAECQPFDENVNYYDKFWKRFLLNEIGKQNVLQFKEQVESFTKRLDKIVALFQEWEKSLEPIVRTKRKGGRSQQYERYFCETCSRGYRDQQALLLHMQIKHRRNEAYQKVKKEKPGDQIYEEDNEDE